MDTTKKLPTVLSLCTGYGGIERGLDLAGVEHRVIAHVEIEAFAIANLVAKMEAGELDAAPVWSNLKTLPVDCFRDRVDILTGGYPCQPFSAAGKRLGKEDPRHLWPYLCDIIRAVRPVRCFFENVEGHVSLGLREVISDLESLGYTTAWGIFSAREVGAPHQRKRVYIMADSSGQRSRDHAGQTADEGWEFSSERRKTVRQGDREKRAVRFDATGTDGANSVANTESYGGRRELRQLPKANESVRESQEYRENEARKSYDAGQNGANSVANTRCAAQRSDWGSGDGHSLWTPEPRLGRVVDGCANRVDRIRLLGNGVVPQTAAKAWMVLSEELLDELLQ